MTDTAVAERPDRDTYKPPEQARTIGDALKSKEMVTRFNQAVPRHLSAERMLRVCAMAVYNNPLLGKCEVLSLLGAMLSLASLGLEPNTQLGHAYLIPFKSRRKVDGGRWEDYYQVNVIIGYKGFIELARRSGTLVSIHADVVYSASETEPADVFSFEYGSNTHLKHIPNGSREGPRWVYAYAKLSDGEAFDVLPYREVLKIRNKSQGYMAALNAKIEAQGDPTKAYLMKTWESSPWVAFEHEMAAKTLIRRLSKGLAMSIEFMRAAELDEIGETNTVDFAAIAKNTELLEHTPTVPFEPPSQRMDPGMEPVAERVTPAKPRQQRKPAPEPEQQPASPSPPPKPPEPARAEPEKVVEHADAPVREEPPLAPTAFELVTVDGEALEWSDWADFKAAYTEEMQRAFKEGGLKGGEGFYDTNRPVFLEWAANNKTQAADLEIIYHGQCRNFATADTEPPPAPADKSSGLF